MRQNEDDIERQVAERTHALITTNDALRAEIAERKKALEKLKQSTGFLGAIIESSAVSIVSQTLDGIVTSWNRAAEEMFGYTAEEMIGNLLSIIAEPGDRENAAEILKRIRGGERIPRLETRRRRKDGSIIHVAVGISPIHDIAGRRVGASEIAYDITDRKRAEADLRASEAQLRTIVETVPDAIIVIDERGIIELFSPAAERLFGYTAKETLKRNLNILMPSPHHDAHDSYLARYLATGERHIIGIGRIVVGKRRDGSTFPMELAVGEVRIDGVRRFIGFVRDLTESERTEKRLKDLHAELIHVSRLSAMGQMAATLAHELNQPLTAIVNYVQAGRRLLDTGGEAAFAKVDAIMDKASQQATRAGQIIRRLRQFVEKGATEHRPDDINRVIEEASALALVGVQEIGVKVSLDLAGGLDPVMIDRIQIQQVVLNLVRNALEAMMESEQRILVVTTRPAKDRMIEVAVRDRGPGLSPEVLRQLFQPFVTTKDRGMGIGLSICRSIVEAHGGRISAMPQEGGGTVFSFTVPTAPVMDDDNDT